ncbi:MAG: 50S ribosomal protein L6 [Elusimicrobia bacterium]|nr:50S ribosomal protein L6 [Elusimicrobiota bacterium]
MSRIGRIPVVIPSGVQVTVGDGVVKVKGPKGELSEPLPSVVQAAIKDGRVVLTADLAARRDASALYGTARARLNNMVIGVTQGFTRVLQIVGLGFRVEEITGEPLKGQTMKMNLGKSHPVIFDVPKGLEVKVDPKKTIIELSGASKDLVGAVAAKIRALRPPEPYKGTGIRRQGEHIRKKAGKQAAGAAGAAVGGAGAKK